MSNKIYIYQLGAPVITFIFPFRFLVLEHVSGGELFDHLVKRGRLPLGEVHDNCQKICNLAGQEKNMSSN